MKFLLLTLVVVSLLQGLNCAQWSSTSPQDGVVKYACKGGSVTLPWKYITSPGDTLGDIQWLYDGHSQEMIAMFSRGNFLPLPAFANRVQLVDNAGITVSHLTVADSGNYSVEINLYGDSGATHTVLRRSVVIQISDQLMTQDGSLHVTQSSEPVLDAKTSQWSIQLQCGTFTFRGDPPYTVEWTTPSGVVVNSSDFSDKHFNLLLTNPVEGGNYTCAIPPQHAVEVCLHGNGTDHVQASISVDRIDARLSLLEKKNEQVQHENDQLKAQLTQPHLNQSQVQSLEQVKLADLQNRVAELEGKTRQQIGFHATGLESDTPPIDTPLVVNDVHLNHGNAYNGTTGYFTAPCPGDYFFAATTAGGIESPVDSDEFNLAWHFLYVDNTQLTAAESYGDGANFSLPSTAHATVHLVKGQTVWIASGNSTYNATVTTFSGFMISPDP